MEFKYLIFSFLGLMIVTCGIVIVIVRWALFSETESSVKRLEQEIEKARIKQVELSQKLKDADEELEKKRTEAKQVSEKLRMETEQGTKHQREEIIAKARVEGEEIIAKAQQATEKMRLELEREMDLRAVGFGMEILNKILTQKSQGALDEILVNEFVESLQNIKMDNIGPEITKVEMISVNPINDNRRGQIEKTLNDKLKRSITINPSVGAPIGGGVILKFGSLALDGSIKNLIREEGLAITTRIETKKI